MRPISIPNFEIITFTLKKISRSQESGTPTLTLTLTGTRTEAKQYISPTYDISKSDIRLWNELDKGTRSSSTVESFKERLRLTKENKDHLDTGTREGQILHARLQLKNSDLKANLYNINLTESPLCDCGTEETTKHFLLECPNYNEHRNDLYEQLDFIQLLDQETLLNGNAGYSREQNIKIIQATQTYILKSRRFKK